MRSSSSRRDSLGSRGGGTLGGARVELLRLRGGEGEVGEAGVVVTVVLFMRVDRVVGIMKVVTGVRAERLRFWIGARAAMEMSFGRPTLNMDIVIASVGTAIVVGRASKSSSESEGISMPRS